MSWLFWLIWLILPPVIHELGHYIAALVFGHRLRFYRGDPVLGFLPRWLWRWPPGLTKKQKRFVAQAGFGLEILGALPAFFVGGWQYILTLAVHFWAYPWYADTANDFEWMGKE